MIRLQEISHRYNSGPLIVENVSFHIETGTFAAFAGPSGSGKSTIAKVMAGYLKPSSGKVLAENVDVTGKPGRSIILISQDSDLFEWQTVEKHILFAQKSENHPEVKELLELTRLSRSRKYYPKELSGGMKKRLSLARALAIHPKLLILDEAFSSLDSDLKKELMDDLQIIWKETKTTIMLISHNEDEISMASRVFRLSGTPATISEE